MIASPAEAADLIEHYQANPERICVSPPGVDHTMFRPGSKERARARLGLDGGPIVAFVGRVQPLKGIDVAIDAVARLDGVQLLVVGGPSGPAGESEMVRLQEMAATLAPGRVSFLPPRPHRDVSCVYAPRDAVIVPSRSESFGLVAVEAQASGTPVVASHVGGLAYAVADGRSGFLIAGHDPAEYAAALRSILEDPATAERLSTGRLNTPPGSRGEATADRLIELYQGTRGVTLAATVAAITAAWVDDPQSDVLWAGDHGGRRGVRMRQTVRDFTTVWFEVGDRTLAVEAGVLPEPRFHHLEVYRQCLARNTGARRLHFALDGEGEILLVGRIPVEKYASRTRTRPRRSLGHDRGGVRAAGEAGVHGVGIRHQQAPGTRLQAPARRLRRFAQRPKEPSRLAPRTSPNEVVVASAPWALHRRNYSRSGLGQAPRLMQYFRARP